MKTSKKILAVLLAACILSSVGVLFASADSATIRLVNPWSKVLEAGEWYFDVDMYNIRLLNESPDAIHDPILLFEMNVYVYEMIEKADFYFNPSTQEIKKISEQNGVTVYRPGDEDYDFLRSCVKQNQYAYVRLVDPESDTLHNGDWYFD